MKENSNPLKAVNYEIYSTLKKVMKSFVYKCLNDGGEKKERKMRKNES
jgi:hypothetical protein